MRDEGFVSICSAGQCLYNENDQCHADGVEVALHADHADCRTFQTE